MSFYEVNVCFATELYYRYYYCLVWPWSQQTLNLSRSQKLKPRLMRTLRLKYVSGRWWVVGVVMVSTNQSVSQSYISG